MAQTKLLLVGAGGHAHACIDVIELMQDFKITGLVGTKDEVGLNILGFPVLASDKELASLHSTFGHAVLALGQISSAAKRIELFNELLSIGYVMPEIVSPLAHVSRFSSIGSGTMVMHGGVINANASVGANCIVNTNATVEHDAVVSDHCHISTNAVVNGGAAVGVGTFIGSGAVILENVKVGENCIIGASVLVRKDVPDGATYVGR